ncbi:peptidoglycan-binding protein [Orenia marismortui]|nr:peptidoglycan-binding protein [Orenia marismortui]
MLTVHTIDIQDNLLRGLATVELNREGKSITKEGNIVDFKDLPVGEYELTVSLAGYDTAKRNIILTSGDNLVKIKLGFSVVKDKSKIKQAQQKLKALEYDLVIDGILGEETRQVIKQFRQDYNVNSGYDLEKGIDAFTYNRIMNQLTKSEINEISSVAYSQAKEVIISRLKSPSTADFPWFDYNFFIIDKNKYKIVSYVDAQNSFGAEIRTHFSVIFEVEEKIEENKRIWKVISVDTW